MRALATFFVAIFLLAHVKGEVVPTPEMAMSWNQKKDARSWVSQFEAGSQRRIVSEFVPKGDERADWKEMVSHQIEFTSLRLPDYVARWKAMRIDADSTTQISEERSEDDAQLISLESSDERSLRLFIKGGDGIYQIAYSVRPKFKDDDVWAVWWEIISRAKLVPNPFRKKKEPNQSLEPTTMLGTSAAEQPLVPSTVVAHL